MNVHISTCIYKHKIQFLNKQDFPKFPNNINLSK